jgi:hypothetical protein
MDPMAAGGMPPMPMDPMAAAGGAGGAGAGPGQKMKPEQMMQMLDFRLYNMQQQVTALLNHLNIQVPAGALVMPPGQMSPTPESAMPGGPQDPSQMEGAPTGGGGGSAIGAIDPIQAASPELAAGGGGDGGAPKMASASNFIYSPEDLPANFMRKAEITEFMKDAAAQAPVGYDVVLVKAGEGKANISSTDGDVDEKGPSVSPPNKALNVPGSPDTTPSLRPRPNNTAGGSKDPKSVTDGAMPAAKSAAQAFSEFMAAPVKAEGTPVDNDLAQPKTAALFNNPVSHNAEAIAAMMRSKARAGQ